MNWMSFIPYALITTFTPGPNNIMSLSVATQYGIKRTVPFALGVWTGFSVVIQLCALLGATLNAALPAIKTPMLFVGAAYLLYLAWKTYKSGAVEEKKTANSGFLTGFLMQFVNPKGIIYGIVSMETYILPQYHGQQPVYKDGELLVHVKHFEELCRDAYDEFTYRRFMPSDTYPNSWEAAETW